MPNDMIELSKRAPLVDRIKAALDEEESVARLLPQGGLHWNVVLTGDPPWGVESDRAFVEHVVRHDPARVLRQVAAMRKVLDAHAPFIADEDEPDPICQTCTEGSHLYDVNAYPCPTLLALAEAYGIEP